jgi:hypothetical protein
MAVMGSAVCNWGHHDPLFEDAVVINVVEMTEDESSAGRGLRFPLPLGTAQRMGQCSTGIDVPKCPWGSPAP